MNEWGDIKTAPRDCRLLVFCEETREPFVAQYMISMVDNTSDWIFAIAQNEDGEQIAIKCTPTHWQPLPKPPEPSK